jgi:predicted component of type VI protein secretion system
MKLILQLTGSSLAGGSGPSRVLERGSLTIGRSAAADWVMPDPARVVSKLHCRIDAVKSGFVLTDTSTNGVFVDGAATPLGTGNSVELRNGDRFRLGDHTITVKLSPAGAEEMAPLPSFTGDSPTAADRDLFSIDADFPGADWATPPAPSAVAAEPLSPALSESVPGAIPENWFAPASAGPLPNAGPIPGGAPALPSTSGLSDAARLMAKTLGIAAPQEGEAEAFLAQLARQHRRLVEGLLHSLAESVALRREFGVGDTGAELTVDRLPPAAVLALLLNGAVGERTLGTAMTALRHHQDALSLAFRDVLRSLPADLAATLREVMKRGYAAAAQPSAAADGAGDGVPPWPQARK